MTTKTADHFSFTKLLVKDLEGTTAFYKEVCGLTELARVESVIAGRPMREIMFNTTGEGAATFVLLAFTDAQQASSDEVILGFITADLVAFVERVKKAGGTVAEEIRVETEHGVKVAFLRDIEGHLLEVVELLG